MQRFHSPNWSQIRYGNAAIAPASLLLTPMVAVLLQSGAIAQTLPDSNLFCFMRTARGQVINLTELCQRSQPVVQETTPVQADPATPYTPMPPQNITPALPVASPIGTPPPAAAANPGRAPRTRGTACILVDDQGRPCRAVS